ncbi:MAG: riboflavin biosynthesis protein RibF [Actinobacteria bacterium]|nr:riboflavin biosynthesis protein RibF [Actinomycetota bacterium]
MDAKSGKEKTILSIGVFDGVHLGHQHLLKRAVELAKEKNAISVAVTFDPLPEEFLENKVGIALTLLEEKKKIINRLGIDYILVIKFDESVAAMSKYEFCRKMEILNPSAIVVGEDFRFGKEAEGNIEDLKSYFNNKAEIVVENILSLNGVPVKSSLIRDLISKGMTLEAQKYLGRRYSIKGEVVLGKGLGKALGFPTANIYIDERKLMPLPGVYSGFAEIGEKKYAAAIFVPFRKHNKKPLVEAYLFDFYSDIYGMNLLLEFHERVSDVKEFSRLEDLQKKISEDLQKVIVSILRK